MAKMNRWQIAFINDPRGCNGKSPRSKLEKEALEILGDVGDTVTVRFPDGDETYTVTEYDNDVSKGLISARVLARNLPFWVNCGYKVIMR